MAKRVLPGLGLMGNFADGEDAWGADMDATLLRLSVLVQAGVKSSLAAIPGSPAQGDVHLLTAAPNKDSIAVYDGGAWTYFAPAKGWWIYDRGANKYLSYSGAAWAEFAGGGGGGGGLADAPSDGKTYGRKNAAWAEIAAGGGGSGSGSGWVTLAKWNGATDPDVDSLTSPDLSDYSDLLVIFDAVQSGSNPNRRLQFSVDGGATYDGANNYHTDLQANGNYSYADAALYQAGGSGTGTMAYIIHGIDRDDAPKLITGSRSAVYTNYAKITNVRMYAEGAGNGTMSILGRKKSSASSGGGGGGTGSWVPPRARYSLHTDFTPTADWQPIPFDTVDADDKTVRDGAHPGRIVIPAGVHKVRLHGHVVFQGNETGYRYWAFSKNSDGQAGNFQQHSKSHAWQSGSSMSSGWIDCAPGDYFCITVADGNLPVCGDGTAGGIPLQHSWFEAEFDDGTAGGGSSGSGGGSGALVKIGQVTVTAEQAHIHFDAIPQTFDDLFIVGNVIGQAGSASDSINCQFNGHTGADYYSQDWNHYGTDNYYTQTSLRISRTGAFIGAGVTQSSFEGSLLNYRNTGGQHRYLGANTYTDPANLFTEMYAGQALSMIPIASLDIFLQSGGSFGIGTIITLYGRGGAAGSGGGSSSGGDWAFDPPLAASLTPLSGDATMPVLTDDADIGLIIDCGPNNTDGMMRGIQLPALDLAKTTTMTLRFNYTGSLGTYTAPFVGVFTADNSHGRQLWFYKNGNPYSAVKWKQGTAGQNSSNDGDIGYQFYPSDRIWMRIVLKPDSSVEFWHSSNGKTWALIYAENNSLGSAPHHFLVGNRNGNTDGTHGFLNIDHLTITAV